METLDRFAILNGAKGASIHSADPLYREHTLVHVSDIYEDLDFEEYLRDYEQYDRPAYAKLSTKKEPGFVNDLDLFGFDTLEELHSLPVVKWHVRERNILHRAISRLNITAAWFDGLALQFNADRGPMSSKEISHANSYLPHFAKTLEINRTFTILRNRYGAMLAALDHLRLGVFILTSHGEVAVQNLEAQNIIDQKNGMYLSRDSRLKVNNSADQLLLDKAVQVVLSTSSGTGHSAGEMLSVKKSSGNEPYLLEFSPLKDHSGDFGTDIIGALVIVIDPNRSDVVSVSGLSTIYGLSNTETTVAELIIRGYTNAEIAEIRGVAFETVRSQVASLLHKTGCRHRSEMVRTALRVEPPIL